jgi:hypothetical protein
MSTLGTAMKLLLPSDAAAKTLVRYTIDTSKQVRAASDGTSNDLIVNVGTCAGAVTLSCVASMWPDLTKVPSAGALTTPTVARTRAMMLFNNTTVMFNTLDATSAVGYTMMNGWVTGDIVNADVILSWQFATKMLLTYVDSTNALVAAAITQNPLWLNNTFSLRCATNQSVLYTDTNRRVVVGNNAIALPHDLWGFRFDTTGQITGILNLETGLAIGSGGRNMFASVSAPSPVDLFLTILVPNDYLTTYNTMDLASCCTIGVTANTTQAAVCTAMGLSTATTATAITACSAALITPTTGWCVTKVLNDNTQRFDTSNCFQFCKEQQGVVCDTILTKWCAGDVAKLKAQPNTCGCFMGTTFYNNYFDSLAKISPVLGVQRDETCIFPACSAGSAIRAQGRWTSPCQNLVNCISTVELGNSGVITGNINIAQTTACGNADGTGVAAGTDATANDGAAGGAILLPFLPVTLLGLSQVVYLVIVAGIIILLLVLALLVRPSSNFKQRRARR